ncbi:DUF4227 family protein [Paenibacillus septentrionalis]|uniref:DUF4227 family protein n=1 Tax=Paenibacillus septentrionalis TaxID=429342 RepID=A0ABW1V2A4_9BACL
MTMMKEMGQRFLFFILFVLLVIIVTTAYDWVQGLFSFGSPYDAPSGDAVKVFSMTNEIEQYSIPDRLLWFFRYGE